MDKFQWNFNQSIKVSSRGNASKMLIMQLNRRIIQLNQAVLINGMKISHDDVIKRKHSPRYWPFVRWIHRGPRTSPHKGQRRGALMFSLICARIKGWVNNGEAGDLRRHRTHYDVIVMPHSVHYPPYPEIRNKWFLFCSHCGYSTVGYGGYYDGSKIYLACPFRVIVVGIPSGQLCLQKNCGLILPTGGSWVNKIPDPIPLSGKYLATTGPQLTVRLRKWRKVKRPTPQGRLPGAKRIDLIVLISESQFRTNIWPPGG